MELFQIEPGLMIWTWISFLCLLAIMYRFVFPTLIQNIKEREEKISKSVDDAEVISKTREKISIERADVLKRSKSEGDEILRNTRKEADLLRKNLEKQAELSAAEIIRQARQKAQEENTIARQQLKAELADFVCETSEKLINRAFVKEEDQKWTRELAESL